MKCIAPKVIWPHRSVAWVDAHDEYPVSVPCGKCMACLVNRRSEWAFRLEQEFKFSSSAYFVTLTYDEKHLRRDRSLCKRDLQLYFKRLRKSYENQRIRYYAVGEYGSKSGRPHYHVLLFNVPDEFIRRAWVDSHGVSIGIVHIGQVTEASVSYVLKYLVQMVEDYGDRQKPFALMSRAYGIGGRYLSDEMVSWHRDNDANYAFRYDVKVRLPRFYKSKIWYCEEDRERISKASLLRSLEIELKQSKFLERKFGAGWQAKYAEMRNAALASVKLKVAFSQTI